MYHGFSPQHLLSRIYHNSNVTDITDSFRFSKVIKIRSKELLCITDFHSIYCHGFITFKQCHGHYGQFQVQQGDKNPVKGTLHKKGKIRGTLQEEEEGEKQRTTKKSMEIKLTLIDFVPTSYKPFFS